MSHWSLNPSLFYVVVAGSLYVLGGLGRRPAPGRELEARLRAACFAVGLVAIVLALDSPVDYYSDRLFWVHMSQHILLLSVAPPLILLGKPWPRMWRALPLRTRTTTGRALVRSRWAAPIRLLAHPVCAWLAFGATLLAWHIPAAYNAALTDGTVHDAEHACFFFLGLLFWAHALDPGPLRPRLTWMWRAVYLLGAMVVGWVLAITLVVVQTPIYGHYAALAVRPGGITALTDQQLAGGMMWVPGSIAYALAACFAVWRWLEPDKPLWPRLAAPGSGSPVGPPAGPAAVLRDADAVSDRVLTTT